MVLGRQAFRIIVLVVGGVFLLVGSLAVPAPAQEQTTVGNQRFGDLTVDQCLAITNNSGTQYNMTVVQICDQVLDDQGDESTTDDNDADDDVVKDSIPDKDLPETGGVPLLGVAFFVLAGAGLLTAVVRRR